MGRYSVTGPNWFTSVGSSSAKVPKAGGLLRMSGTAASPGSTTGTESGESHTDTSGGSPTSPPAPTSLPGPIGLLSSADFGSVTSPIAGSLPVTVAGFSSPDFTSRPLLSVSTPVESSGFGSAGNTPHQEPSKCTWCAEPFRDPKVLACFHTFCKPCLEGILEHPGKVICPQCHAETQLCTDLGVDSLLSDYGLANLIQKHVDGGGENSTTSDRSSLRESTSTSSSPALDSSNGSSPGSGGGIGAPTCTGCKSKESSAVSHCQDCANFLCPNCVMAHQYMHCFEGHRLRNLSEFDNRTLVLLAAASADRPVGCLNHRGESVRYFCFTCNIPICRECTAADHPRGLHQFEVIQEVAEKQLDCMQGLLGEAKAKQMSLVGMFKAVDAVTQRLRASYAKASLEINETANFLLQAVDEQRQQALRELEASHSSKQVSLAMVDKKLQQTNDKLSQTIDFMNRLLKYASPTEALVFKKLLETRLQAILAHPTDIQFLGAHCELEFLPASAASGRAAISSAFGVIRGGTSGNSTSSDSRTSSFLPPTPIGRPPSRSKLLNGLGPPGPNPTSNPAAPASNGPPRPAYNLSDSNLLQAKQDHYSGSSQSLGPFPTAYGEPVTGPNGAEPTAPFPYEKWSSGGSEAFLNGTNGALQINTVDTPTPHHNFSSPELVDLPPPMRNINNNNMSNSLGFPPRSQIKRHKMIYYCKFGEFGVMEGQFTEPSGVTVNAQNDIIVADTNNHRIQVFDREGRFKFQFGECGKRDGQLLYPNRVAVNRATGDIVVTERSPTHQIQVYSQRGDFQRKFGANILQHPRGVTVDNKGRIVVIECKVMRVLIFDMYGNILQKFSCNHYLNFPNGVCANDKQEIFISDNRAHCIKVFNYEGQFLRQLGGEGITNYPIGVGINQVGEVVVADNHNNFNLTIFQQDGTLVSALESKVKHAQCFDVALLEEGSVVLASKDYRLYLYRYMQNPAFAPF